MTRSHGSRWVALLAVPLLGAGCSWGTEPSGSFVPTSQVERALLEELVVHATGITWYGARFTDGGELPHLAFGGWLVGRDEERLVHISLATTDAGTYEEFCDVDASEQESGFWTQHDMCSRLRISDAYYVDLYFTEQPHRLPDDRHELRYPSEHGPAGTVVYPQNPLLEWWYVFEPDGSTTVRVEVDTQVRFESEAGDVIAFDHEGRLTGSLDPNQTEVTLRLELAFPELTDCPVPLEVVLEDDATSTAGRVTCGDVTLARITHPHAGLTFEWMER